MSFLTFRMDQDPGRQIGHCRLPETFHTTDVSVTTAKTSDTTCMESMVTSNIDMRAT